MNAWHERALRIKVNGYALGDILSASTRKT